MGRGYEETFFQRRYTDAQRHTWKDVQYHQRNEKSKPQWDTTSSLLEWLLSKRQEITSVGEDVEKRKPTHTVGEKVNWCSHYGKQYGESSKN